MPSNPAVAAAAILSSSVPERQTVAIARRGPSPDTGVADQRGEVGQHPPGVGLDAGEQPEGVHGLEHRHAAAVEHTAAQLARSEEHTSELQSRQYLVCRLLLEKKIDVRRA